MALDGVFNETVWGEATPVAIPAGNCSYGTGCGSVDLAASASFRTVWNANGLWIGVTVSDPGTLYADNAAPWNGSGVEIFLDLNNTRGGYNAGTGDYNDANTYQWTITYNSAAIVEYHNATARTILAASKATPGTGYAMEIEIPWANLGVSAPSAGAVSGLEVVVDVADAAGTVRDHAIVAYNGSFNPFEQTPAEWGGVQYDACDSYTATNTPVYSATYTPTMSATFTRTLTVTPTLTPTWTPTPGGVPTCLPPPAVGANTPFITWEAEAGTLGGGASVVSLTTPTTELSSPQLEASGHAYVALNAVGQSVQWTNTTCFGITAVNIRACVPDSAGGGGINTTLDLYVNGTFRQAIPLSSTQTWVYETTSSYNGMSQAPSAGERGLG